MDELKVVGYRVRQQEITEQQLVEADEVFLTNSIFDIRWVRSFRDKTYIFDEGLSIYKKLVAPLYC